MLTSLIQFAGTFINKDVRRMSRSLNSDLMGVLKGLNMVINNAVKLQERRCQQVCQNSSLKTATEEVNNILGKKVCESISQSNSARVSSDYIYVWFQTIYTYDFMWTDFLSKKNRSKIIVMASHLCSVSFKISSFLLPLQICCISFLGKFIQI